MVSRSAPGFALFENLYYLATRPETHPVVQVIRGFGTAIMHGGATAIFAFVVDFTGRTAARIGGLRVFAARASWRPWRCTRSTTRCCVRPVFATLGMLMLLPPLIYFMFERSEQVVARLARVGPRLGRGAARVDQFGRSRTHTPAVTCSRCSDRFRGPIVADMLCYLRLHVELALRAKGVLMLKESGFEEHAARRRDTRADRRTALPRAQPRQVG